MVGICDVGVDVEAVDLVSHLASGFVGEVHYANFSVLFYEAPGRLAAYAGGAAGNDGDFPFEASWHI